MIALLVLLLASAPVLGQEIPGLPDPAQSAAEVDPIAPEAIRERTAALAAELAASERALAEASGAGLQGHLTQVRDGLLSIDALLRQQAKLAEPHPTPAPQAWVPDEVGPPSLAALDQLYEAQFEIDREASRLADAHAASRDALALAKQRLEEAEKRRREARGEVEAAAAGGTRANAERALELRRIASRIARERVHLRTLETRAAQRAQAQARTGSELAERIAQMREALAAGRGEAKSALAAVDARQEELRQSRKGLERSLARAELRLDAAQKRFAREASPPESLLEEIELLNAERDTIAQHIELLDAQIERLEAQRKTWQQWETLLAGEVSREELETWKLALAERLDAQSLAELRQRGRSGDVERRLDALRRRSQASPARAPDAEALESQRSLLADLLDSERKEAGELAHDRRLTERVLAEVRDRSGEIRPLEHLSHGLRVVRDAWSYEVTAVDDSAITVGSLVLALLLASIGLWASRRGASLVSRVATERFRLDAGAAHALQTLSFYVFVASFTLLALRAVHFPLTAFTVLGGALAIGIGFGSQNVMNNFISGLILMLERPVRARDVVEVDGNYGTVERIGARSTQIRSQDGRHIIVPNSFFLESNVVNWTLSDDLIRTAVSVGVSYGSPTRLVEELLRRVVDEEERVLKTPDPVILFGEFGDNALNFEVQFWVRARSPMAMRIVQSQLRFRIDELFREHGLVIAFPQRDVHLDTVAPIEVRVLSRREDAADQPPQASEDEAR